MREFKDGDTLWLEPWRAKAFPVIKDLTVDRSALDRIIAAGGFVSVNTGSAPTATPPDRQARRRRVDGLRRQCIGCGACVAACPNAAAMLFTGAKVTHLVKLPQGQVERGGRVLEHGRADGRRGLRLVHQPRRVLEACPKEIKFDAIVLLNREARVLGKR
jgi:succinate dehydrogenase / fumarate reductase iron-sulfur subunit